MLSRVIGSDLLIQCGRHMEAFDRPSQGSRYYLLEREVVDTISIDFPSYLYAVPRWLLYDCAEYVLHDQSDYLRNKGRQTLSRHLQC